MTRRRRVLAGVVLAVAGLAVLGALFHRPLLEQVATTLVVDDRPERADAIVLVAGGSPWREAKAAALFREGWAPRIMVSRPVVPRYIQELTALGVRPLDPQGESQLALQKYGVPFDRIIALTEPTPITEVELHIVHERARASGYRRVLLVTSPEHTRRVKVIWSRESRQSGLEGITVAASGADIQLDGWWRKRRAAEAVLHEYLGLAAIYLGISHLVR